MQQRHPLHRNRFSLMFRLPQVDPSAFDALLRQMPDIVIDFSSAIPARARARPMQIVCDFWCWQGAYDGSIRMTPGQELVFTAKVRLQPVYLRGILGQYKLSFWNTPLLYVRMRR